MVEPTPIRKSFLELEFLVRAGSSNVETVLVVGPFSNEEFANIWLGDFSKRFEMYIFERGQVTLSKYTFRVVPSRRNRAQDPLDPREPINLFLDHLVARIVNEVKLDLQQFFRRLSDPL